MAKAISTIERTRVATPLVPSLTQVVSGYDITELVSAYFFSRMV